MLRLDFRRPPVFTARALLSALGISVAVVVALSARAPLSDSALGGVLAAAVFSVSAYRLWRSRQRVPPLVVDASGIGLPLSAESARAAHVPFRDLLSLSVNGGARGRIAIATRQRLFVYPLASLAQAEQVGALAAAIREHIAREPDGPALLQAIAAREQLAEHTMHRPARFVRVLLVLLLVGFAIELYASGASSAVLLTQPPLNLLRLGANSPALVRAGQWYRLCTANFLHANLIHLYFNGAALYSLGLLLEPLLGIAHFAVIYLGSALGGSLGSTLAARAPFSVGASTAVFGLLGSYAVIERRFRSALPASLRQSRLWWIVIVGVNSLLSLLPFVDGWAHLGGALSGGLLTLITVPRLGEPREGKGVRIAAGALIVFFLLGIADAVRRVSRHEDGRAQLLASYAHNDDPQILNYLAWSIATDDEVDPALLSAASGLAAHALAMTPDVPEIVDTQATIAYRQQAFDEAVQLERMAFADEPREDSASQLARFLHARIAQRGAIEALPAQLTAEGVDVTVKLPAPPEAGELLVVVMKGKDVTGLLQLFIAAERTSQVISVSESVPDDVTFELGPFSPRLTGESRFWPMTSDIERLP
jgi:rhomboid protease GluP